MISNDFSIASTKPIQGLGCKSQEDCLTLALVVHKIGNDKLEDALKSVAIRLHTVCKSNGLHDIICIVELDETCNLLWWVEQDVDFQYQQTSLEDNRSYFCSVWYGEDIMMGLLLFSLSPYYVMLWKYLLNKKCSFTLMYLHFVYGMTLYIETSPLFLKTSILQHLRPKHHILQNTTFNELDTFLHGKKCHSKERDQ